MDEELEVRFEEYEEDFGRLLAMSDEDSHVIRIAPDFTWLDTSAAWPRPESELGISLKRWDEYRNLFEKLGVKEGILRSDELVLLIVSARGLCVAGETKGYVFSEEEPAGLEESLDDPTELNIQPHAYAFKKLKGNRYLFYQWDD
jgi:hypothetical protein